MLGNLLAPVFLFLLFVLEFFPSFLLSLIFFCFYFLRNKSMRYLFACSFFLKRVFPPDCIPCLLLYVLRKKESK